MVEGEAVTTEKQTCSNPDSGGRNYNGRATNMKWEWRRNKKLLYWGMKIRENGVKLVCHVSTSSGENWTTMIIEQTKRK